MKKLSCILLTACIFMACNSPEQNTTTGNTQDSTTIMSDSTGGMRGGTPGSGTLTDTANRKSDTPNHTSK